MRGTRLRGGFYACEGVDTSLMTAQTAQRSHPRSAAQLLLENGARIHKLRVYETVIDPVAGLHRRADLHKKEPDQLYS